MNRPTVPQPSAWATPFEQGNGNQSSPWPDAIAFHQRLADAHPHWLRFLEIGRSDGGRPIHAGVFSADGVFDAQAVKTAGRTVFLNNNGIHPGEPEGIDACMALVRDLCLQPARRAALGSTVLVYIPVYNVDGAAQRGNTSRVNQDGPEAFGFRGNARHLDLNRDFIKADSLNTRCFTQWFMQWDPDVMVDTHTSNGADYQNVVTLIATQPDKLGGQTGAHLRAQMLPALYAAMAARGMPMCPYVNTVGETPDDGIADFLDTPRFSTGYAALHHCIGFMPETHMLKPFAARYQGTLALLEEALAYAARHGSSIRVARAADRAQVASGVEVALNWALDAQQSRPLPFAGFEAVHEPSRLGPWQRLRYDRTRPWQRDIRYFDRHRATTTVRPPLAYLLPQAWHDVALRLQSHGLTMQRAAAAHQLPAQFYRVKQPGKRAMPFEGRHLHSDVQLHVEEGMAEVQAGDWIIALGGPHDRAAIEMLEPLAADSFFRWAFFDSVLDRKESYSDYAFEDEALRLLATEPGLQERLAAWQAAHPALSGQQTSVLDWIFHHAQACSEPAWRRYPVARLLAVPAGRAWAG